MQIKNHLLFNDDGSRVSFVPTPNKGGIYAPQYLIIHYTAVTTFESTLNHFKSPNARASAHLLKGRDGRITQFAPFNIVTFHAGESNFRGLTLADPLPTNTKVQILKSEGTWSLVEVMGTLHGIIDLEGWVSGKFLVKE